MAIYKPPKSRWPFAVFAGVLGFLLGIGLGMVLGSDEPDPAEGVRLVQQELTAAAAGLEVAGIEYTEAVDDGEVLSDAEYQGSLDALSNSRDRFESVEEPLGTLAPALAEEISTGYDDVEAAMEEQAPSEEVQESLDDLSVLLKGETN